MILGKWPCKHAHWTYNKREQSHAHNRNNEKLHDSGKRFCAIPNTRITPAIGDCYLLSNLLLFANQKIAAVARLAEIFFSFRRRIFLEVYTKSLETFWGTFFFWEKKIFKNIQITAKIFRKFAIYRMCIWNNAP